MIEEQKFIIDFILSLTYNELMAFQKLSQLRDESIEDSLRYCMNEKCKELLEERRLSDNRIAVANESGQAGESRSFSEDVV